MVEQKRRALDWGGLLHSLRLGCLLAVLASPAVAIQINVNYDAGGLEAVNPCAFVLDGGNPVYLYQACPNGVDRTPDLHVLMLAAAAHWGARIPGNEVVQIDYFWHLANFPDANVTGTDGNDRPDAGRIRIQVDWNYYYDATPANHSEFDMGPRIYRGTHPDEQIEAFSGNPPEVFEVSFTGIDVAGVAADLYTVILHEMAHTLGLDPDVASAGISPECDTPPNDYYEVDPFAVGGAVMAIKAWEEDGGPDFDCAHLALGGIQACNNNVFCESHQALMWTGAYPNHRTLPGAADVFAVTQAGNWPSYDLARKYSLGTDNWGTAFNWIGNEVPGPGDGAFIMNTPLTTITILVPRVAESVTVTDGNRLLVLSTLDVGKRISLQGVSTILTADLGSTVQAMDIDIDPDALLDVPFAGMVDSFRITNDGEIRGAGTVDAVTLTNTGKIRSNGGAFLFTSSGFDPPFDLDGDGAGSTNSAEIQAVTGDLTFDGQLLDPLRADIRVAANRTLTFTQGWTHELYFNGRLNLEGTASEARIGGDTLMLGLIEAQGLSRFLDDLTFSGNSARLTVTLNGTTPGSGHSQINVDGVATLDGILDIGLEPGYAPTPGDEFVILTAASVIGQFTQVLGLDLGGNKTFDVIYGPGEVRLALRAPVGGVPDGNLIPGPPLTVEHVGNDIRLSWNLPCTGERDFEVYEGFVGDFASHSFILCTTNGQTTVEFTPAGGFTYYIVVPHNGFREGSYGFDSDGIERLEGVRACLPKAAVVCGPM